MIDTHYHLDQLEDTRLDQLLGEARAGGVEAVIAPATGVVSARRLLQIQARYPDLVKTGVGIHPERKDILSADSSVRSLVRQELKELWELVDEHREHICAIGEIGLPYYSLPAASRRPQAVPEVAWEILAECLELAKRYQLPVVLHAVHVMARPCLELVLRLGIEKAVFHWLKAPDEVVDEIVAHGFWISVTPEAVYRERDQRLLGRVPLDQLLLETDGPWPHQGPYQNRLTHPLWVGDVARTVARIHGVPSERVLSVTSDNARRLFRMKGE